MENCVEREGYALAAGLALGFVCVRAGPQAPDHIAQRLRTYMLGGDKHPLTGKCILLFPTLILLGRIGTTCFVSCHDKDSAIIFTSGRLPDVNPP
jgi:hypothetical protein